MEEITVKHTAYIIDPKFGDTIFNGTYLGRRVTIHKEDYEEVVERHVTADHVLRVQAHSDANYTIKDTYACTLSEFLSVQEGECDMDDIKCTEDEKKVLRNVHIYSQSDPAHPERHSQDSVNLLRDLVFGMAELKSNHLCHGNLNPNSIVLCVIEGQVRAKLTQLKPRADSSFSYDYKSLGMLIGRMFSSGKSYEVEDLRRHINKQPVKYGGDKGVIDSSAWKYYQIEAEKAFEEDPRTLLKQPIFYTDQQCLTFLVHLYGVVKKCLHDCFFNDHLDVITFLNHIKWIRKSEWFSLLNKYIQSHLIHPKTNELGYDKDKVSDLLKFIRHMSSHIEEKHKNFQAQVGEIPDGFFEYFRSRYPTLLLEAHKILRFSYDDIHKHMCFNYKFKDFI